MSNLTYAHTACLGAIADSLNVGTNYATFSPIPGRKKQTSKVFTSRSLSIKFKPILTGDGHN